MLSVALMIACTQEEPRASGGQGPVSVSTFSPTAAPTVVATSVAPSAAETPAAPTSTPTPLPSTVSPEPLGFPIDPALRVGVAEGAGVSWGAGPPVETYSLIDQPDSDPARANAGGWNCRTHEEYEGQAAVDWYIPVGMPVHATMPGTASLLITTTANAFDVHGVSREPYLGNPDRGRAPPSPFPGPGGRGVFVRIENEAFVTQYAHLDIEQTASLVPPDAWLDGYELSTDFDWEFGSLRESRSETLVARWPVQPGDVIGVSGDSGYSEAPHLHSTVARQGSGQLCPTLEAD